MHITDYGSDSKGPNSPGEKDGDSGLGDKGKSVSKGAIRQYGRPDVPRIVREFGRDATSRSRVAVIGEYSLMSLTFSDTTSLWTRLSGHRGRAGM